MGTPIARLPWYVCSELLELDEACLMSDKPFVAGRCMGVEPVAVVTKVSGDEAAASGTKPGCYRSRLNFEEAERRLKKWRSNEGSEFDANGSSVPQLLT